MKPIYLFLFFVLISLSTFASNNNQDIHHHHHGSWEVGIAAGSVFLLDEGELALGLHSHLLWKLNRFNRFSLGLGAESVFDEHLHVNAGLIVNYNFWKGISASVSPGILFLNKDNRWETHFSTHFEFLYEFEIDHFHLGPILEYSFSDVDKHLMLGLHLGYSF